MAQLSRIRVNLRPLFDNSKYHGQVTKYFSTARNKKTNVNNQSKVPRVEELFSTEISGSSNANNNHTFEELIVMRKNGGRKSILVEVRTEKAIENLAKYCEQFGEISQIYHYSKDHTRKKFALLEFKQMKSKVDALNSGVFERDAGLPVRSSAFWFCDDGRQQETRDPMKRKQRNYEVSYLELDEKGLYNKFITNHVNQGPLTLSNQLFRLYNAFSLNHGAKKLRFYVISNIENCLSNVIHGLKIYPFGSSVNEFGNYRSDLDLLCKIEISNYTSNQPLIFHTKALDLMQRGQKKDMMINMANFMAQFLPGVTNVQKIMGARIPIIKFHESYTNLHCDLSVSNRVAFHMSELLYIYGSMDKRVRPLVFSIRKWAEVHEITCPHPGPWITNFSLSLLVLFFLQTKKILPTLDQLHKWANKTDIRTEDECIDCTFLRNTTDLSKKFVQENKNMTIAELLYDFFNYYSKFDFHTTGICIRKGHRIPKPEVSPLFVQNPFEYHLNITKNVTTAKVEHLKSQMQVALYLLEGYNEKKVRTFEKLFGVHDTSQANASVQGININKIYEAQDTNPVVENHKVNRLNNRTKEAKMESLVKQ